MSRNVTADARFHVFSSQMSRLFNHRKSTLHSYAGCLRKGEFVWTGAKAWKKKEDIASTSELYAGAIVVCLVENARTSARRKPSYGVHHESRVNHRRIACSRETRNTPINMCYHVKSGLAIIRLNSVSSPWSRYTNGIVSVRRDCAIFIHISIFLNFLYYECEILCNNTQKLKRLIDESVILSNILTRLSGNVVFSLRCIKMIFMKCFYQSLYMCNSAQYAHLWRNRKSEEERKRTSKYAISARSDFYCCRK